MKSQHLEQLLSRNLSEGGGLHLVRLIQTTMTYYSRDRLSVVSLSRVVPLSQLLMSNAG